MDLQAIVDIMMAANREERMKTSPQLSLGEIILKLENITDDTKPVVFDFGHRPTGFGSWRGSYCELALGHAQAPAALTTAQLLHAAKEVNGKTLEGYKGGDFYMSRRTPVWVANYGECRVHDTYKGNEAKEPIAITDIKETDEFVVIVTLELKYS
jgi:hypothetical protein